MVTKITSTAALNIYMTSHDTINVKFTSQQGTLDCKYNTVSMHSVKLIYIL